jgi:hypothetical protein
LSIRAADSFMSMSRRIPNGVVVSQNDTPLPDGAHVEILMSPVEVPSELQSELNQWDKASNESWAMIDAWGAEDQ